MTAPADYVAIADYGVIANGVTAALVSRAGSIDWCCLPRLDAGPAFGGLLDRTRGGMCRIAPTGPHEVDRQYVAGSMVLATTFRAPGGTAVLYDLLPAVATGERPTILRILEGRSGAVECAIRVEPRFDYGEVRPWLRRDGPAQVTAFGGDDALVVCAPQPVETDDSPAVTATVTVRRGERFRLSLESVRPEAVDPVPHRGPSAEALDRRLERAIAERGSAGDEPSWVADASKPGCSVARSAAVLRSLIHPDTGAMAAAATTSLPEVIGGARNWDYRYSWIRDSTLAAQALAEIGYAEEAHAFRRFVARSAAGHGEELQIAYGLGGERRLDERELTGLEGYRGSRPVRTGNDAVRQLQLDAIGQLVGLAWHWQRRGHVPDDDHWRFLASVIDVAAERWDRADAGIWEWRGEPRHFVHSKALCWSALDRGIRLAHEHDFDAPVDRWATARDAVGRAIAERGYDARRNTFVQTLDGTELDAALLRLPVSGFVDWRDERMVGTVDAIRDALDAGRGLLFRHRTPDGLDGREGAFLACGFWLAECLAHQQRWSAAREAFAASCATANDLGLFSEQYDPERGLMLGNLPQALTHLSHIAAAVALQRGT